MKTYILRGACAGVLAALATAIVLLLIGEQSIREAIALEDAAAAASGALADEPMFTRNVQVLGGSLGVLLYGAFLGTIFGIVFAATKHRLGAVADWRKAVRLAGLGFVSVYLVPFLKYPPNPPAVGDPETITQRTVAYLAIMAIAIIASVVAVRLASSLATRGWADHVRLPAAVAFWVLLVGIAYAVLPASPDAIAVDATLIWRFRLASLAGQAAFWAVGGVVFGWLSIMAAGQRVFSSARTSEPVASRG